MSTRWQRGDRAGVVLRWVVVTMCAAGLLPALIVAPAMAVDATMTFVAALNVDGLLSGVTVQPATVTIAAGGDVGFANATNQTLTVTVGGQSTPLAPGGSTSLLLRGAVQQETFVVTATARDPSLVGSLTSSVGRVVVRPLPPPAQVVAAAPHVAASANLGPSGAAALPAVAGRRPVGSVLPGASTGGRPGATVVPSAPRGSPSGAVRSGPGGAEGRLRAATTVRRAPRGGARAAPRVLPSFPGFSTARDQLGLVMLLAAVVLAGLGAALVRTVLAYRRR